MHLLWWPHAKYRQWQYFSLHTQNFYCISTLCWPFLNIFNHSFYYGIPLGWHIRYMSLQRDVCHSSGGNIRYMRWHMWVAYGCNVIYIYIYMCVCVCDTFNCLNWGTRKYDLKYAMYAYMCKLSHPGCGTNICVSQRIGIKIWKTSRMKIHLKLSLAKRWLFGLCLDMVCSVFYGSLLQTF